MLGAVKFHGLQSAYIPPVVEKPGSQKLLVVLHGLGDSLDGFRFLPDYLKIPGLHYLLLNAPDHYFTGYSWYDIYGDAGKGIIRSREILSKGLDQLTEKGWNAQDIGLFGFSQGCLMALDIACRYPKVLAGVVGVSGYVGFPEQYPEAFSPVAKKQKIFVTHGTEDPLLPIEKTSQQVHAIKGMGMNIEWREYEKVHTIDERNEIPDIRRFLLKIFQN